MHIANLKNLFACRWIDIEETTTEENLDFQIPAQQDVLMELATTRRKRNDKEYPTLLGSKWPYLQPKFNKIPTAKHKLIINLDLHQAPKVWPESILIHKVFQFSVV